MHIAIDVREACKPKKAGKGQWTYGFVTELLQRNHDVLLLTDANIPSDWQQYSPRVLTFKPGWTWHLFVRQYLLQNDIDYYVSPTSFIVPFLVQKKQQCIVIVHDLIAFMDEPHNKKAKLIERLLLRSVLQCAALVCTVSNATKNDVLERFSYLKSESIVTIYAGPMSDQVKGNIPDNQTILSIGTLCPRKNQLRLIQAYDALSSDMKNKYKLVLAGASGWDDEEIIKAAEMTAGVTWKKYVDSNEYEELMNTCTVFAFPSLYEGFGMQILDALQRGIPLLISDRGSLKEVAGEAGLYVDPENVEGIQNGLELLLSDNILQKKMVSIGKEQAKRFSWKNTVDLFLSGLSDVQQRK